jgi:2-polyprenyl-6-methoxyphenol hydroxylase-like FAD-dependent oxidoreductase
MNSPFKRKALVIGGGITGSITAMFLKRAGIDPVIYEAQDASAETPELFTELALNGLNILKTLGLDIPVIKYGFPTEGVEFFNGSGKFIGAIKTQLELDAEDAEFANVIVTRSMMQKVLFDALLDYDIPVDYNKKLVSIRLTKFHTVIATFADGTEDEGDFLVACDGIHSRTRQIIMPHVRPGYTGTMTCSGVAFHPSITRTPAMQVFYGKQAVFGYFATPSGDVCWFSDLPWSKAELKAISEEDLLRKLHKAHGEDAPFIAEIIRATRGEITLCPVYDLPSLSTWHKGPVVLVGNAAHTAAPHFAQDASMALEDAIILAQCVRDIPDLKLAFMRYERMRAQRIEELKVRAQSLSEIKPPAGGIVGWLQGGDSLTAALKRGADMMAWIYDFDVDWYEELAAPNMRQQRAKAKTTQSAPVRHSLIKSLARQ